MGMYHGRRNEGLRILLLDTKGRNPNHYICLALRQALEAAPGVECVIKADYNTAIDDAVQHRCNLFFAFDGEELDRVICARVAAVCNLALLWVTEDPYELSRNVANADLFDLIFTNDTGCVSAYGAKGRHLPLAGSRPFHWRPLQEGSAALRYDTFFAGTAWPNRVELIRQLLDAAKGGAAIKAKIALPTNEHLPAFELQLPKSQFAWRMAPPDFASFANRSVSTILLPRLFSASGNRDFAETPPPRLYEAALAGTVQLVQSTLAEAAQYFEPGQDFIYFDTAHELLEAIRDLRADGAWRNQIAGRAQAKALARHCYEHRVAEVLAEVGMLQPASRAPILRSRPRLLFVVHNVVENGNFGGVEVYAKQIAQRLADTYDVFFYVPAPPRSVHLLNPLGELVQKFDFSQVISESQLSCREREEAFSDALTRFGISVVHFHHLIGHVPSLVEIARALGVSTAMTFHDHYAICQNFLLLSFRGGYCRPDEIPQAQCDICLWNGHHALPGSQSVRRAYWDQILGMIDLLVFNTSGVRSLNARIFPAVAAHKNIAVLSVPIVSPRAIRPSAHARRLSIAVLGNFTAHKGADVVARVIALLDNREFEFHIFGRIDTAYRWLSDARRFPAVHVHGPYSPTEIPSALGECDVSLHLSIFPETYCLTLSECFARGLVPIVADIGALGERVVDGVNGLKIAADAEGELLQALRRLAETPDLLDTLRANISAAPIAMIEPHCDELRALYKPLNDAAGRHAAAAEDVGALSLAKLHRPAILNWTTPLQAHSDTAPKRRLGKLLFRGVGHLRRNGFISTCMAAFQYTKRHL
jgi:glycosyltransferase involved in cell wall biosynthesis/spore maturation protein CgeB